MAADPGLEGSGCCPIFGMLLLCLGDEAELPPPFPNGELRHRALLAGGERLTPQTSAGMLEGDGKWDVFVPGPGLLHRELIFT